LPNFCSPLLSVPLKLSTSWILWVYWKTTGRHCDSLAYIVFRKCGGWGISRKYPSWNISPVANHCRIFLMKSGNLLIGILAKVGLLWDHICWKSVWEPQLEEIFAASFSVVVVSLTGWLMIFRPAVPVSVQTSSTLSLSSNDNLEVHNHLNCHVTIPEICWGYLCRKLNVVFWFCDKRLSWMLSVNGSLRAIFCAHLWIFIVSVWGSNDGSTFQVEMSNIFCKYMSQIMFLGVTSWSLCRLLWQQCCENQFHKSK
jgi:hypothetical protein